MHTNVYSINYSILLVIIFLTLIRYLLLLIGWSSNSLYSILGAMRVVSQTLSYEVRLIIIILVVIILGERYRVKDLGNWQDYC